MESVKRQKRIDKTLKRALKNMPKQDKKTEIAEVKEEQTEELTR